MHKDVVFCLEDKHEVESTRDSKWHTITERTLTERIDKEYCTRSSNRSRVCNTNPWTHSKTVGKFPLTTHVAEDTDQEVKDNELVRTTVVEPFIKTCCFPNWIEVKSNCIRRRNNSTRDNVVSIHERTSNWFPNTVNIDSWSSNKRDDKADSCSKESWNHKSSEPSNIKTVVCGCNPLAKRFPHVNTLGCRNCSSHFFRKRVSSAQGELNGYNYIPHHPPVWVLETYFILP